MAVETVWRCDVFKTLKDVEAVRVIVEIVNPEALDNDDVSDSEGARMLLTQVLYLGPRARERLVKKVKDGIHSPQTRGPKN